MTICLMRLPKQMPAVLVCATLFGRVCIQLAARQTSIQLTNMDALADTTVITPEIQATVRDPPVKEFYKTLTVT